jgi:hypothetical protein
MVNAFDDLLVFDGSHWQPEPSRKAKAATASADGTLWILSNEPQFSTPPIDAIAITAEWGGFRVYRRRPRAEWEYMHAAGTEIDAGTDGAVAIVNQLGDSFTFDGASFRRDRTTMLRAKESSLGSGPR